MQSAPEAGRSIEDLMVALEEKRQLFLSKGCRWGKKTTKRIQLQAEITSLETILEQARLPVEVVDQSNPPGNQQSAQSRRSSMSVTEDDTRPTSPLTPSPSSQPGSPVSTNHVIAASDKYDPSGESADLHLLVPPPVDCGEQLESVDNDISRTHVVASGSQERSLIERCLEVSHKVHSLNHRFDAADAERAKSFSNDEPYASELTRAFGTPPKTARNWPGPSDWTGFYVAPQAHNHYNSHPLHISNVDARQSDNLSTNFNGSDHLVFDPLQSPPNGMNIDTTESNGMMYGSMDPFSVGGLNANLRPGTVITNDNVGMHADSLYTFRYTSGQSNTTDINMLAPKAETLPRPSFQIQIQPETQAHDAGSMTIPQFTPDQRNLKLSALRVDELVRSIVDQDEASPAENGRVKRTQTQTSTLTGRAVGVDVATVNMDQYQLFHFNWGSYDDIEKDREVYLEVIEKSCYKDLANVANQYPTSFKKHDVYKLIKGPPFEVLPAADKAILQARGRVAIREFIEQTIRVDALTAKIKGTKGKSPYSARLYPNWVKKMAVVNADFLPEAATTSIRVSLEFLTNTERVIACRYHHIDRRLDTSSRDGPSTHKARSNANLPELFGVAHPFVATLADRKPGHAHCGCALKDILLDFFLFKTRGATSSNEDPEKGLQGKTFYQVKPIPTVSRAYYHATYTALTGFDGTSEQLYVGTEGWGDEPGDWKTPAYDFLFQMGVVDHTFREMGVNPWVLFGKEANDKKAGKQRAL